MLVCLDIGGAGHGVDYDVLMMRPPTAVLLNVEKQASKGAARVSIARFSCAHFTPIHSFEKCMIIVAGGRTEYDSRKRKGHYDG